MNKLAHKSKHAEEKNKKIKKRAVENNTAQPKKTMKTSTIEVQINQMPNQTGQPNNKNQKKIKKVQKVKPENKKNKSKLLKWFGIIGLIIVVGIFLFTTPLFNVTEIEVKGNSTVNSEEIKSLS